MYLNSAQRHQVINFRFLLFPTGLQVRQVQPLLHMPAIKDELKSWEGSGMFLSWLPWLGCLPRHTDYGLMMATSQILSGQYHIWDIFG